MTSNNTKSSSRGKEIIERIRAEPFNQKTESRLQNHPYLKAAENGTLTLKQRQAFAQEQFSIQLSDAISFASLAGHSGFLPTSLSNITTPDPPPREGNDDESVVVDLFQFLLGGEIYAASLLLNYAKGVNLDEKALSSYQTMAGSQGYPSYWARLALSNNRAAGAAACAVNFGAWGAMCHRLCEALGGGDKGGKNVYGYVNGVDDEGLAFVKFFATPIEELDEMAAVIIEEENASYEDLVEHVRLLQEYEVMFWDAIF